MNHHLIQFQNGHDDHNNVVKINPTNKDDYNNVNPALKINRNSHSIKKSPPSSLSSSPSPPPLPSPSIMSGVVVAATPVSAVRPQQPRHPVIIYTHSPKVIHTHPKDFKALVQKLTGLAAAERRSSRPVPPPPPPPQPKPEPFDPYAHCNGEIVAAGRGAASINDDYDATSVVTDEREGSSSVGHVYDPQNNTSNSFDNNININNNNAEHNNNTNNNNNNNNNYNNNNSGDILNATSMDYLCAGPSTYGKYVDSLVLMRNSISASSYSLESMKDVPDF